MSKAKALWGGRFKKEIHPLLKSFSYSLAVDIELFEAEIAVDCAWAKMLAKAGVLKQTESRKLVKALKEIEKEIEKTTTSETRLAEWVDEYEDIHSLIQTKLENKVGVLGRKIHTGRSRNDLVVTSTRLYLRDRMIELSGLAQGLQAALVKAAEKAGDQVVSGMTHLRRAQPVLLAHHLLAYVEMLEEDLERLVDCGERMDVLPLGSAALAGSGIQIDQKFLAAELGFSAITRNSMAMVSDRAFITELMSVLSIMWMHFSRLSEDFILWNSEPFGYVELDDAFATGSSLMPQKKNPDVFELVRGKTGAVFGALQSMLVMQKGLPLTYNRDLQEDKPLLFDTLHETRMTMALLALTVETARFVPEAISRSVDDDVLYATDILDYLVHKKMQ